jgi:hypothetical protein
VGEYCTEYNAPEDVNGNCNVAEKVRAMSASVLEVILKERPLKPLISGVLPNISLRFNCIVPGEVTAPAVTGVLNAVMVLVAQLGGRD